MTIKRRTLTVFGDRVNVTLQETSAGIECAFDHQRNPSTRRDIEGSGFGETEQEAIAAYIAECHRLERMGADLYR